MANSFGDQFLKAGLVSKDQVHKAKKSKHKQKKQNSAAVKEAAVAAQKAAEEKAVRDRELNRQRKKELERKAIHAQVRQLIEMNRRGALKAMLATASAVATSAVGARGRTEVVAGESGLPVNGSRGLRGNGLR